MNRNTEVHVYAVGSFGASVADVLRLYIPSLTATYSVGVRDVLNQPPSPSASHVLAVATPAEADCSAFTRWCYASSCVFVPLTLQPDSLWLGPITGPRSGPCWNCAMRRYEQHRRPNVSHNLGVPELPESLNVSGSLLPLIASGIWYLLHVSRSNLLPPGFAWRMDLRSHEITGQKVVTIHRCDFCGLGPKEFDVQAHRMRDALSHLYSKSAISSAVDGK